MDPDGPASALARTRAGLILLEDPDYPEMALALGDPEIVNGMHPDATSSRSVSQPVVAMTSLSNVGIQALQGHQQAANLVRLSPETVAALKSGSRVIKSGGWNLGVLRASDSGKFVGQVKWAPVGGALSAAAGVANAATMAMIQMQLAAITKQLEDVSQRIKGLEESRRISQLASIEATVAVIDDHRKQAETAGLVTDKIMSEIRGHGRDLDQKVRELTRACETRLDRLRRSSGTKGRREWLEKEGAASVEDLSKLVLAVRGWAEQRAMYAANLAVPVQDDPDQTRGNEEAAREAVTAVRRRLAEVGVATSQLAYELDRALHLTVLVLGEVSLGGRVKSKLSYTISGQEGAEKFAKQLRSLLEDAGIPTPTVPGFPSGVPVVGEDMDESYQEVLDRLMYLVSPEEELLGAYLGRGAGRGHNLSARRSVLLLTSERVIGLRNRTFKKSGDPAFEAQLDQIERVAAARSYQFTAVRIAMKEGVRLPMRAGGTAYEINLNQESSDRAVRAISEAIESAKAGRAPLPIGPVWDRDDLRTYAGVGTSLALDQR